MEPKELPPKPIADAKKPPSDMAPNYSGNVVRRFGGRTRTVPIVAQSTLEGSVEFQANTSSGPKRLQPIEELARQIVETGGHANPELVTNARKQRLAIKRNARRKPK